MLYFIVYLLFAFWGVKFASKSFNVKKQKTVVNICLWIFVLIAGLRYEIGYDYFAYQNYYEECIPINQLLTSHNDFFSNMFSGWEPGVILLFSILKTFFQDSQIVFFATSIICSLLLFKTLKYFCEDKYLILSILIYYSFVYMYQEMHALRQAMGACIFYYGLYCLARGNKKQAICITLLASCFHYSMLLFFPLLFFLNKKLNKFFQIITLLIVFGIFICRIKWIVLVINYGSSLFPALGIVNRVLAYTEMESFERPFFITFILYILPYIFMLVKDIKHNFINSSQLIISYNLYFLYLIFTMIFWEFAFFSIRYGWICLFGMAVCLPKIIDLFNQHRRYLCYIYILLFCFMPIRTFLFPDITTSQFSPYEGYISRKILGIEGTGKERVENYINEMGKIFKF